MDYKYGLAVSYSKLGNIHSVLGNLPLAFAFFEQHNDLAAVLHEACPQNVKYKNNLAISYYKLGIFSCDQLKDDQKSKAYLQKAEVLWVELVLDAPEYLEFQQYLSIVRDILSGLDSCRLPCPSGL